MAVTQIVEKTDHRIAPDRRDVDRGGRRATDLGGQLAPALCDGCSGLFTLQWVAASQDLDEYRCRRCRCRIFAAR